MDTYDAIHSRHSVRDFQNRRIEQCVLERVLDAGLRAPSNDHLRSWEFVIVDDPARRLELLANVKKNFTPEEVSAWLDSWNSTDPLQRAVYMDAVPKQHRMLLTAGSLILPFFRQHRPLLESKSLNDLNFFASIWCCVENIFIAASAEGIQGVVRIPFPNEIPHIKRCLGVPSGWETPCYIALGYPAENAPRLQQIPVCVKDRIQFGKWER